MSINPRLHTERGPQPGWPAGLGGGGEERTQREWELCSCLGVGGLGGAGTPLALGVTIWMRTQGEGGPQLAPECQVARKSPPAGSCCSRLVSETRIGTTPGEVRAGSDPASVTAAGSFPRSLTSNGLGLTRAPCASRSSPTPSWPGRCEAPQGKDQRGICPLLCHRKTPGAAPTQCLSRKPPSPGALREGPQLRMQTTRLPGGGSETQLKSITAGERRAPSSEKERLGNPAPHPCRNPRLGMRSQPLAKERHSRVED